MACINWSYYKANPTYKARIETLEGMFGSFHAELFIRAYNKAYPDKKELKYDFYIPSYKEAISFLTSTKQQAASRFIEALDNNNNLSINDVPLLLQGVVAPIQGRLTVISGRIKSRQAGVNPILSLNLNALENINHKYPETFIITEEAGVHYVQYTSHSNVRRKYLNNLIKEDLPTQQEPQIPRSEALGFGQENNTKAISNIYSKLGNKTKSENVVIRPWSELKDATRAITPEGIVSTRIKMSNAHFGNPFTSDTRLQNLIQTKSTKESVERYINWILTGETGEYVFTGIQPEELENQREWILEQLKSGELKGKPILYYKELGEPSHATALDYLINKYDWNAQITLQQKQLSSFIEKTITVKKDNKSNWTLIVKPDGSVVNANNNKEITDERLINKARLKAKFYNYRIVENVNGIKYAITDDNRVFTLAETTMGKEISKNSSTYPNIIAKGYAPNFYNKYKNNIKSIDQAENYIKAALKTDRENTLNKLKDCF